eukprot:GEMP01038584.1.p1 GENE.GEMP01038584.1~~GEMP01038584.1.p1  ORF type:complete len:308 (+),score=48.29 GEMP01038584.1:46-924(+)
MKGGGKGRVPDSALNTLLSIDHTELQRLADMAKTLQQGGLNIAKQPTMMMAQQPVVAMTVQEGDRFFGTVKSFNEQRGFGFIHCPQLQQMYGSDVFLHKNEYLSCSLFEGASVSFGIQLNPAGQPQANMVRQEIAGVKRQREPAYQEESYQAKRPRVGVNSMQQPARFQTGKGGAQRVQPRQSMTTYGMNAVTPLIAMTVTKPYQTPFVQKQAPISMDGGPYLGIVKSYNEGKGYGFIQCEETFLKFRRDIFIHKNEATQIPGEKVGTSVTFTLQANEHGHPQAVGLTLHSA